MPRPDAQPQDCLLLIFVWWTMVPARNRVRHHHCPFVGQPPIHACCMHTHTSCIEWWPRVCITFASIFWTQWCPAWFGGSTRKIENLVIPSLSHRLNAHRASTQIEFFSSMIINMVTLLFIVFACACACFLPIEYIYKAAYAVPCYGIRSLADGRTHGIASVYAQIMARFKQFISSHDTIEHRKTTTILIIINTIIVSQNRSMYRDQSVIMYNKCKMHSSVAIPFSHTNIELDTGCTY